MTEELAKIAVDDRVRTRAPGAASTSLTARRDRQPSVAVILPAYNEELTIGPTIRAFFKAIPEATIVVVDNNSSDRTAALALETFESTGCLGRMINEPRQGKGLAVRRAFYDIDAAIYVLADADMTYPADRVRDLMQPVIDKRADMVVGDRQAQGHYARQNKRPFHNFGNRLVLALVNALFDTNLHDIMSGYRAFSANFVLNYPIMVTGFQIETDMTLHALDKRFRIAELPIECRDRPEGSYSKLRTLADGRRVLLTILHVVRHYRPLLFFGLLAVIFGATGLITALPVIGDWIKYQYIYRVPLAILSTGLELMAALFFGIGLVLDSVVHLERTSYEKDLLARRHEHHTDGE